MRTLEQVKTKVKNLLVETDDCIRYLKTNREGYGDIQYYNEDLKKETLFNT